MNGSRAITAAMQRATTKPDNVPTSQMSYHAAKANFSNWDDWDNGHTDGMDSFEIQDECRISDNQENGGVALFGVPLLLSSGRS